MQQEKSPLNVSLEINGRDWRQVEELDGCGPAERVFTARVEGSQAVLTFGDGKHGRRPPFRRREMKVAYSGGEQLSVVVDWGHPSPPDEPEPNIYLSLYRGVVTSGADPENRMRLKVQVPEVLGMEDAWALACLPAGAHSIPAAGKHVWVMFEHGDPRYPVWIGVLKSND